MSSPIDSPCPPTAPDKSLSSSEEYSNRIPSLECINLKQTSGDELKNPGMRSRDSSIKGSESNETNEIKSVYESGQESTKTSDANEVDTIEIELTVEEDPKYDNPEQSVLDTSSQNPDKEKNAESAESAPPKEAEASEPHSIATRSTLRVKISKLYMEKLLIPPMESSSNLIKKVSVRKICRPSEEKLEEKLEEPVKSGRPKRVLKNVDYEEKKLEDLTEEDLCRSPPPKKKFAKLRKNIKCNVDDVLDFQYDQEGEELSFIKWPGSYHRTSAMSAGCRAIIEACRRRVGKPVGWIESAEDEHESESLDSSSEDSDYGDHDQDFSVGHMDEEKEPSIVDGINIKPQIPILCHETGVLYTLDTNKLVETETSNETITPAGVHSTRGDGDIMETDTGHASIGPDKGHGSKPGLDSVPLESKGPDRGHGSKPGLDSGRLGNGPDPNSPEPRTNQSGEDDCQGYDGPEEVPTCSSQIRPVSKGPDRGHGSKPGLSLGTHGNDADPNSPEPRTDQSDDDCQDFDGPEKVPTCSSRRRSISPYSTSSSKSSRSGKSKTHSTCSSKSSRSGKSKTHSTCSSKSNRSGNSKSNTSSQSKGTEIDPLHYTKGEPVPTKVQRKGKEKIKEVIPIACGIPECRKDLDNEGKPWFFPNMKRFKERHYNLYHRQKRVK